jgi:hypothetical protein
VVVIRAVDETGRPKNDVKFTFSEQGRDDVPGVPFTASGIKERRQVTAISLVDGIAVTQFRQEYFKLVSAEFAGHPIRVVKIAENRRDGSIYVHADLKHDVFATWGAATGLPEPLRKDFTVTIATP